MGQNFQWDQRFSLWSSGSLINHKQHQEQEQQLQAADSEFPLPGRGDAVISGRVWGGVHPREHCRLLCNERDLKKRKKEKRRAQIQHHARYSFSNNAGESALKCPDILLRQRPLPNDVPGPNRDSHSFTFMAFKSKLCEMQQRGGWGVSVSLKFWLLNLF